MIINFEAERIRRQFKEFNKTGEIPEAMYACQSTSFSNDYHGNSYYARMLLVLEARDAHNKVKHGLLTTSSRFKLPYTLSKYRKGINPIIALYEELQRALFSNTNMFDDWIIQYSHDNKLDILRAINCDILSINEYESKYHTIPKDLEILRDKFVSYLEFLETF